VELVAFALFPAALLLLGVVTGEDRRAIGRVAREALPKRSHDPDIEERVRELHPGAIYALEVVVVRQWSAARLADHLGTEVPETEVRLVSLLRKINGPGPPTDQDQRIGKYLFSDLPVAELDALARTLWSDGVDPSDLHALEKTIQGLQRLPARAWEKAEAPVDEHRCVRALADDAAGPPREQPPRRRNRPGTASPRVWDGPRRVAVQRAENPSLETATATPVSLYGSR
jgi:hypothetical protein